MLNPLPQKIFTVSDFQRNTKPTFDDISKSKGPVLVMNRNNPVGVFLNPKVYNEVVEMYEDFVDGALLEKATKARKAKFRDVSCLNKLL